MNVMDDMFRVLNGRGMPLGDLNEEAWDRIVGAMSGSAGDEMDMEIAGVVEDLG